MNAIVVTGTGLVGPAAGGPVDGAGADNAFPGPGGQAFRAVSFDPVRELGRKPARFNHRTTLMAIAACGAALRDAGIEVTDANSEQIGVTLGTHCGSVGGSVAFGWESYVQPRPGMVNPAAFPNLVINAAAGAAAIHHGLRGTNTTVAGGPAAGISALRHSELTVRAGHVDTVVAGAAEEYGSHEAWLAAATRPWATPGEAAGTFVVESADTAEAAGRRPLARVAATTVRTVDPAAVREVLDDALSSAGVTAEQVRRVALRRTGMPTLDEAARAAVTVFSATPRYSEAHFGDCHGAHAAVQLVETVRTAADEKWTEDTAGVVLALDPDGAVAVAVLTGPPAPVAG